MTEAAKGEQRTSREEMADELHLMKTAGVVEVAVRNPNVSDYMHHWEHRAIKAEHEVDALSSQLEAANQRAEMLADSVAKAHAQGKAEGLREAAEMSDALAVEMELYNAIPTTTTRSKALCIRNRILALIPAETPAKVTVQEAAKR